MDPVDECPLPLRSPASGSQFFEGLPGPSADVLDDLPTLLADTGTPSTSTRSAPRALSAEDKPCVQITVTTSANNRGAFAPEPLRRRLASAYLSYFVCGWGDGITGTILPYLQADFHLSYTVSSLLFVGTTIGFAIGTLIVERVMAFLGRFFLTRKGMWYLPAVRVRTAVSRHGLRAPRDPPAPTSIQTPVGYSQPRSRCLTLLYASVLHAGFFVIMGARTGFPGMFSAYVLAAFSRAFTTATLNAYVAATPNKPLGHLLGSWYAGCFAATLVCQTVIATGVPWANFYFGSLVISATNTALIVYAFRPTRSELAREGNAGVQGIASTVVRRTEAEREVERRAGENVGDKDQESVSSETLHEPAPALTRAIKMPYLWAFSCFIFIYTGSETASQGFLVTFLLKYRNANPHSVGYVSSGFWGGVAVSQLIWGHATPFLSFKRRKYIIHGCIAVGLVMYLLIWFLHSNELNSICFVIIGLAWGSIFPGTFGLVNDILPPEVHLVSMAVLSAVGSFGSALFPFFTGLITNVFGAGVLVYVGVAQSATLFLLWFLFPSHLPSVMQACP